MLVCEIDYCNPGESASLGMWRNLLCSSRLQRPSKLPAAFLSWMAESLREDLALREERDGGELCTTRRSRMAWISVSPHFVLFVFFVVDFAFQETARSATACP